MVDIVVWVVLGLLFVHVVLPSDPQKFARRVDLDLASAPADRVARRFAWRNRGIRIGGSTGIAAGAAIAVAVDLRGDQGPDLGPLLVLGGAMVGIAVALLHSSSQSLGPLPADEPRIARTSVPVVGDYVPAAESWLTRAAVLLGIVAVVALVLVTTAGLVDVSPAAPTVLVSALVALAAAGALVGVELWSRRLVDRPQPAGSVQELAWDDALRAATLRDAVAAPLALGVAAVAMAFGILADGAQSMPWANAVVAASGVVFWVVLLGLLTFGLVSIAVKPDRHFRRRLWPELTPTAPAPTDGTR